MKKWHIIGFVLLGFAAFWPSLSAEFIRFDDQLLVTKNPIIWNNSFQSIVYAFTTYDPELYIPLTLLSYKIDFIFGGGSAFMFHLSNLLLHIACSLLIVPVSRRLGASHIASVVCGLLFLVHPLHTEAVSWVSARKDILSSLGALGSLYYYLRYKKSEEPKDMWKSCVCFTLGLLSKVGIILLPLVLLSIDWLQGRKFSRQVLIEKIPFFCLSLLFGIVALGGKTAVLAKTSGLQKILMAGKSTVHYLSDIVVPHKLSLLYPYIGDVHISNIDFLVPWIVVATLFGLAFAIRKQSRLPLFCLLFFVLFVAPTFSNFAKGLDDYYIGSDRYAYLASVGILLMLSQLLYSLTPKTVLRYPVAGVVVIFSILTFQQSQIWSTTESVFANAIEHYPQSHIAHTNLANTYLRDGNVQKSIDAYNKALSLKEHPRTLSNIGSAYLQLAAYEEAELYLTKALELNPNTAEALANFGKLYTQKSELPRAIEYYERSVQIDPTFVQAAINLGGLYKQLGQTQQAYELYKKTLLHAPFSPELHFNMGVVQREMGDVKQAQTHYYRAIELQPDFISARLNLGLLLYNHGNHKEAVDQFVSVLEIDPSNTKARSALLQIQQSL